jgi:hypothetical protein
MYIRRKFKERNNILHVAPICSESFSKVALQKIYKLRKFAHLKKTIQNKKFKIPVSQEGPVQLWEQIHIPLSQIPFPEQFLTHSIGARRNYVILPHCRLAGII